GGAKRGIAEMSEIVVVGSVNVDLTSYLTRWPAVGETVTAASTQIGLGGKGANQAVAAARLGHRVSLVAAVGQDSFGQDATARLRAAGVDLVLGDAGENTGMAFIDVGPEGGNIIRLSEGANATLTPGFIEGHADLIAGAKVLLLQNEVPVEASLCAAGIARAHGTWVVMDPAPAPVPFWDAEVLAGFDVITPNAHEVHLILGAQPQTLEDARAAAADLVARGPRGAVVTMGGLGVAWQIGAASGQAAAPQVSVVDTVAAGDCFNGALGAALAEGRGAAEAIAFAVHAGALATTRRGAAEAAPSRAEVDGFVLAQRGPSLASV
ncbi:MAG: ribokinase, partial [Pseudomonadota bacterium]